MCGPGNVGLAGQLGADHVSDYTQDDYTQGEARCDLILDNVANRSLADARRAVAAGGSYISNSALSQGRWFGAVGRMMYAGVLSMFVRRQGRPFCSPVRRQDLVDLTELIEGGKLRPVIDRTYPLAETAAATDYIAGGLAAERPSSPCRVELGGAVDRAAVRDLCRVNARPIRPVTNGYHRTSTVVWLVTTGCHRSSAVIAGCHVVAVWPQISLELEDSL